MTNTGEKGYQLEELLRAYFLRAGMYAARGVPLQQSGDDLTDVDIWLYERSTGSSRRRQIVDAKSKAKPKAIERILWTKGLQELLKVDGAYVATPDTRAMLQEISSRLGISILDGADIKRMSNSEKILFPERISEEDLDKSIKSVDKARRNKELQINYRELKSSLISNFGPSTTNRALEHFIVFAKTLTSAHPNSATAEAATRLSYIAASIIAIAIDFSLAKVSFKPVEDRRKAIINLIRYGDEDEASGMEKVRIASALIERYTQNGRSVAQALINNIQADYQRIPAEIIADHVLGQLKGESLFRIARSLEHEGFRASAYGFDQLPLEEKSFIGAILDFSGIDRSAFAESWTTQKTYLKKNTTQTRKSPPLPLFENTGE